MNSFFATYFDGKTSRGKNAEVFLMLEKITINYIDVVEDTQLSDSIDWDITFLNTNEINVTSSKANLTYGTFPKQIIEFSTSDYENIYQPFYKNSDLIKSKYHSFQGKEGTKKLVLMAASVVAIIACLYFFIVPLVAENLATTLVVPELEQKMGDNLYDSFTEFSETDSIKTVALNKFYRTLNFKCNYNIRLTVLKSNVPNAFALPGGNIVVHDSIIRLMNHSEELAALLSHEVSHVHHRHSLKALFRNLAGYFLISLVSGDVNGVLGVVLNNANSIKNLEFSRSLEQDADITGLELLKKSEIDPNGMIKLFENLNTISKDNENSVLSFLSTHPLSAERIFYVKNKIRENGHYSTLTNTKRELLWNELRGY